MSAVNHATLHALVYEEGGKALTDRVVVAAASAPINNLADGETGSYTITVSASGASWPLVRSVVIADYFTGTKYDTLQAALVD
jgi:hypothetical protein